jgi:hypothetical protein
MEERWTKVRSDIALAKKKDPNADVTELRRDLKAAHLAEYVRRLVGEAPALSPEQRDRIAQLLRSGGGDRAS